MWTRLFLMIVMLISMQGCQSTPAPIDTGCMAFRPIDTNVEDRKVIPRAVKLQIAQHNEMWDRKCGNLKSTD